MSNSMYIAGMGPGSGKSVIVLGVMELLTRQGRKIGFFRPVVAEGAAPDHLAALVTSRYDLSVPVESMFGVTHATARDLISRNNEEELYSRILEKYRGLAEECDFVVCAGTDYKAMHTALEFEFNVEVARNLGAPLLAVVAGQDRSVGEIVDAVRVLSEFLDAKKCDVLSVIVNRVARDDVTEAAAALWGRRTLWSSGVRPAGTPPPRQAHSRRNKEGSRCRNAPRRRAAT